VSDSLQLPFGSRDHRIAYNESWSRSLNESHAEWSLGRDSSADFRCECWRPDCAERISLSAEDWKLVRSEPNQFAVAPNHVAEDFEAVITTCPDFWLVEKFGEAGEIAEKLATPTEDRPNPSQ
jgi:hypothetical protein